MTAPPKTIEGGLVGTHTHTNIQCQDEAVWLGDVCALLFIYRGTIHNTKHDHHPQNLGYLARGGFYQPYVNIAVFSHIRCRSFSSKKTHPDAKAGKESGAIMLYLAEKYQRFIPNDARPFLPPVCEVFLPSLWTMAIFVWGKYAN